ncbi:MAG: T9SS type A sorting domain-containing protein [Ignavibacteria bacterium]|nr:T9SS type A sorting domain-containing protein [Ignavibacteria bacterium]
MGDSNTETFVNTSTKLVFGPPYTSYRIRILWEKEINGKTALIESFRDANLTSESSNASFVAEKFSLSQNYPNPFNPVTVISYSIPSDVRGQASDVKLVVYNNLGKEIITLVNEKQNAGSYAVDFNGEGLPSGVYFYKLEAESLLRRREWYY